MKSNKEVLADFHTDISKQEDLAEDIAKIVADNFFEELIDGEKGSECKTEGQQNGTRISEDTDREI